MTANAFSEALVQAVLAAGICDERLIEAVRMTPRAGFVPVDHAGSAYEDMPIGIGHGQVTTQPSLSARMIESLGLEGGEHVLEVGTGLGYQTALLAYLVGDVVSVERLPDLMRQAERNLAEHGIDNVELLAGDGSCGAPDRAPYDAIIVSAAFTEVPAPLIEQLRPGGRLVQPIGPGGQEDVVLFERTATGLTRKKVVTLAAFVRLHGRHGFPT
ncbi:protein-L-isoaspartate(D-aspartate) O-methyltransferase [Actinomadura alba]|uniref:protein-L-isoaspartate(D-aspartate) O-methyltransferase n=1 Tax=Actinomadura alba TaxID=406431 RepID=UPI0028B05055|nr:protein-L-isoaspartate(D-aspartate) O-methyltransferase [Actinomadura alba]